MVLNDGETYTDAGGCLITTVTDEVVDADMVEGALDDDADEPLAYIHRSVEGIIIELTDLGRKHVRVI